MLKRILFLASIILTLSPLYAAGPADEILFRLLDTSSGLPDNNVRNMIMLPDGQMYIQTSTMLNIYNGASCKSYRYNPVEIPYKEYSGMNASWYDREADLLWCTTRDHIWVFDLKSRIFLYDIAPNFEGSGLGDRTITGLYIDDENNFWLITDDSRLWKYRRSTGKAEPIELLPQLKGPITIHRHDNSLWLLSLAGWLAEYDLSLNTFKTIEQVYAPAEESSRMDMTITASGNVWVMFDKTLELYDIGEGRFRRINGIVTGEKDLYTSIALDASGNLWVGTARSGVSIIEAGTGQVTTLPWLMQTNGKKIYHHTDISKIYADSRGGVWIATLAEGLLYWNKDIYHLHTVNSSNLASGRMPDESVKCLVEDVDGTVLVGTISGLLRYDPRTNSMTVPYPELRNKLCISLYRDSRDRIWVGTFYNGAYCIENGRVRHYLFPDSSGAELSYYKETPNYNCVRAFYEDYLGNFWVSVYGGVGVFDVTEGKISMLREQWPESERYMVVRDICDHGDGTLLFSGDNGRFLYNPSKNSFYADTLSVYCNIQSNQAILDDRGLLWIATAEGLRLTDNKTGQVYFVTSGNGLPNDNIISLETDNLGNVWAATFNCISRIKPVVTDSGYNFVVSNFNETDGVTAGAFFQNSILKHSDGTIYFGGAHGISIARPDRLYQESFVMSPKITDLHIAGRRVDIGEEVNGRVILPKDFSSATHLDLKHDETSLTFSFSNLNYVNPTHTAYRYILVNFDKEWHEIHSESLGRASYTYLPAGDYVFKVYAADNGTDWSPVPAKISITIHPPFYKTVAAYIFYVFFVLGTISFLVRSYVRRKKEQIALDKERDRQKQQKQLDQMKFRFFTNISHELRTPLSLILLPLESLLRDTSDSGVKAKLETMHHNASELLSLVNHLLDFRKLETGGERQHLVFGNIGEFVSDIVDSFKDALDKKGVSLEFENNLTSGVMAFDNSQISKVVNNLLSNAMKFTPSGGYIGVRLSEGAIPAGAASGGAGSGVSGAGVTGTSVAGVRKAVILEVTDSGIGIDEKDLPHIFERFYQSEKTSQTLGSGIGLSLVKQYVEMHQGRITATSSPGNGSTFKVILPMDLMIEGAAESGYDEDAAPTASPVSDGGVRADSAPAEKKYTVMVVDDNPDFRAYIAGELSRTYHVEEASDGVSCLKKMAKSEPTVIVCDVMMPNMDGFEVTKRIKDNIETSHIPVILLTARTSDDTRLEGYEHGADAYLTKPFNMDILEARIRNLIEDRERRIKIFTKNTDIQLPSVTMTGLDEKLMSRIMESIEKNMDNSEYSVEDLSSDVNMHRMNLYRKLQSLAGMTPSEFIRSVRLKRAARILRENPDISVVELSEMVGFNTPKYFTKYFKEMFGASPSEYRPQ